MEIKIRNVDFVYGADQEVTDAHLRYDTNEDGFGLNGYVKVTIDEYNANASDIVALAGIVKAKLQEKVAAWN
jgi:hypothetical protein